MPESLEPKRRFDWIPIIARFALIASLVVLTVAMTVSMSLAALAISEARHTGQWLGAIGHIVAILAEVTGAIWLFVIYGILQAILSNESGVSDSLGQLSRIESLLENQGQTLQQLADLETLSDQAKSLIYREREIQAIQEAVHDDLVRQDYEAADYLIDSVQQKLGYGEQAEQLRRDVEAARKATLEEKIDLAITRIQQVVEAGDWPRAYRAAEKLLQHFPDNPKVIALPQRVQDHRGKHKSRLLEDYGEAVRKNDVDRSIELLKQLDQHLSPQEAAALRESARGIFRAKLHNLGVQFAICVNDGRWLEAVTVGEEIVRQFPNSRMSHEVRQKMPQLRTKAAEVSTLTNRK